LQLLIDHIELLLDKWRTDSKMCRENSGFQGLCSVSKSWVAKIFSIWFHFCGGGAMNSSEIVSWCSMVAKVIEDESHTPTYATVS
jgi:hypothetical protein